MNAIHPGWQGLGVALATPYSSDGSLDRSALASLTRHVVAGGADFVVALGSTGEAAMLTEAERDSVVDTVLAHAGAADVLVGTGASSTAQTIAWTRRAHELGAHGALVVVPPYTRPTPTGVLAHFRAVGAAVPDLPLIAYNVPARTGTNLSPATLHQLWALPNVVAVKESSGDLGQIGRIAAELPPSRTLLAGDDHLALATIAVGGAGLISVAGNVAPSSMHELVAAARRGDLCRAQALQHHLQPLFDALSTEPNPIPIKTALALVGLCNADLRLPLLQASTATRDRLAAALDHLARTEPDLQPNEVQRG